VTKPPDYSALRFWFDVAQCFGTIGVAVYVWLSNRTQTNTHEIEKIRKDVAKTKDRVTKVETDMVHALSHEDLGAVYERITDVSKDVTTVSNDVSVLSGKMDSIQGTLDIIQDHLLNGKGQTS